MTGSWMRPGSWQSGNTSISLIRSTFTKSFFRLLAHWAIFSLYFPCGSNMQRGWSENPRPLIAHMSWVQRVVGCSEHLVVPLQPLLGSLAHCPRHLLAVISQEKCKVSD